MMNQLFGPNTTLRLKLFFPPLLVLLFLIGALSVVGNNWLREVSQRLAASHAESRAADLVQSHNFQEALKQVREKSPSALLNATVDNDPRLLFAVLKLRDKLYVGTRSGSEGEQLSLLLSDPQRYSNLAQNVTQRLASIEFSIARRSVPVPGTQDLAELTLSASLRDQVADYRNTLWIVVGMLAAALAAYLIASIYVLSHFGRRMDQLVDAAQRVQQGDLNVRISNMVPDDIAMVGRAFDLEAERLSSVVNLLQGAAAVVERASTDVSQTRTGLARTLTAQTRDVEEALQMLREVLAGFGAATTFAEQSRDESRQAASGCQTLAANVHDATNTVEEAERVVALTSDSLGQVANATADIAKHADTLSDTTSSTASAMLQMKHSITRVRETAITAASLAEQAGVDAERGTQVLEQSMIGMEHIREASAAIGTVTEDLEKRVSEIGDVLHLITELTQRTNLLALNASIIAAQAGAEGRGFAVVADEIKDLARRTANSAGSIDNLIQAVAEGAHAARRAAVAGGDAVEAGTSQASEAAKTMTDILGRLRNSAAMSKSIASATDEQARSSAYVTRSIQDVQNHVTEITGKAVDQTRRTEYLQRQVSRLRELVDRLAKGGREERDSMTAITESLMRMTRLLDQLVSMHRHNASEGERLRNLMDMIRRGTTSQREQSSALERCVGDLTTQANELRGQLSKRN
ncbi:MAG TPA: methyl-accepting chemotaxis protein [Pseudomonadota bacterium]|jgi:methyl-accepting chemotaxis protein|nr:methyl-accepting chemotaxis protein [Pseudomonadota bacterium]